MFVAVDVHRFRDKFLSGQIFVRLGGQLMGKSIREKFGQIVRAKRLERIDAITHRPWNRARVELETESCVLERTIKSIEEGKKAHLDIETLRGLAKAFKLNRLEWNKLHALAHGIGDEQLDTDGNSLRLIKRQVLAEVGLPLTPTVAYDDLFYIVGANAAWLHLKGYPLEQLRQTVDVHHYNHLLLFLQASSPLRLYYQQRWRSTLSELIAIFRIMSLPHCHRDAYNKLVEQLRTYPEFEALWRCYIDEGFSQPHLNRELNFKHPRYGELSYFIMRRHTEAAVGDLHVAVHAPTSEATGKVFQAVRESQGNQVFALAKWFVLDK